MKPLYCLLPALLFLVSCGKQSSAPSQTEQKPSAPPEEKVVLEEGGEFDPIASQDAVKGGSLSTWGGPYPKSLNYWLDPNQFSATITGLLFEPLVSLHTVKDEPVGVLANSWEVSEDGKTFTFHIDPKATWSDGKPVTADDVQFYYDVIMNPKNLTPAFRVDLSRFSRPEIIDEKTLRITANEQHWANFWTAAGLVALPKHAWKDTDFNKINFEFPVVSGPYQLDEVKTNRSVSLKRRTDWWGGVKKYNAGKYNFDKLFFLSMEDRNKVLEVFKKGELDLYPVYTAQIWAEKTDFPSVKKNWVVRQKVSNKEPKAFQGFVLNMRRPLFQNEHVRKALAYLLNRELMNEKLMFNQYFVLNSYYPDLYPNNVNPDFPVTKFDPEKARALFKEAGYEVGSDGILAKDGKPLAITILHYDGSDLRHLNIYLEDLKAVGIQANIDVVSRATFTKRMDNHEFDMLWMNYGAGRLRDPEPNWLSTQADQVASANHAGVKDPEIDALIEQQKTEMDLGKRNDILRKIDARLIQISPYVLMWQSAYNRLLYWNKFGTPKYILDKFNREDAAIPYWWYDARKDAELKEAMKTDSALPPQPAEIEYTE